MNRTVIWMQQWALLKKNNCVTLWPKSKIWSLGRPLGLCYLKNHQIYHLISLIISCHSPLGLICQTFRKKSQEKKHKHRTKCFYKVQSLCHPTELKINSCILQYRYLSILCTWCKLCGWKSKVHSHEQQRACINISIDSKFPIGHYFSLNLSLYHTVRKKIFKQLKEKKTFQYSLYTLKWNSKFISNESFLKHLAL